MLHVSVHSHCTLLLVSWCVQHVHCKGAAAFCKASKIAFKALDEYRTFASCRHLCKVCLMTCLLSRYMIMLASVSATKPRMQYLCCLIIYTLCLQDLVFLHQPYFLDSVWPDHQSSRQLGHAVYATKWRAATCL